MLEPTSNLAPFLEPSLSPSAIGRLGRRRGERGRKVASIACLLPLHNLSLVPLQRRLLLLTLATLPFPRLVGWVGGALGGF
jgi:hypothetical protein